MAQSTETVKRKNFLRLYRLQQQGIHTNCTIKIGQDSYKAHTIMLAASSRYFSAKLDPGYDPLRNVTFDLTGLVESEIFNSILRFLYVDEIWFNKENLAKMTRAAELLQIDDLKKECTDYVEKMQLNQDNSQLLNSLEVVNLSESQTVDSQS